MIILYELECMMRLLFVYVLTCLSATLGNVEIFPAKIVEFTLEEGKYYDLQESRDLSRWSTFESATLGRGDALSRAIKINAIEAAYFRANPVEGDWVLVWEDEFESRAIDRSKWMNDVNANGGGNKELQYYTDEPENSFIERGNLVIVALKERYTGLDGEKDYTSAKLTTKFRGIWKYGRIDVRARLPIGQGIWPAIWMLPQNSEYGKWSASGEIDIVETLGHEPTTVHGTIHYGGQWPQNQSKTKSVELESGTVADDFHTYSVIWDEGKIQWFLDGNLYHEATEWSSSGGAFPAPFDEEFYLILNVAVGGNWPGNPDLTTLFPVRMEVDYVRVYQRID